LFAASYTQAKTPAHAGRLQLPPGATELHAQGNRFIA